MNKAHALGSRQGVELAFGSIGSLVYTVDRQNQRSSEFVQAYKKIVLAVDLSVEAEQVIERARSLDGQNGAILILLHVVEPVITESSYDLITSLPVDYEQTLYTQAEGFLRRMRDAAGLESAALRVESGSVKSEILRVAEEEAADLIVVGTHGRHGVGLLLGSTANSVLHGTPCDVLAVRIQPTTS